MKIKTNLSLYIFLLVVLTSIFFRLKIIHELPLGVSANEYGLTGFDDEPAHLNYTKYVLENDALPILENKITDPDASILNEFEFHQPPFYYTAIAVAANIFSISDNNKILIIGRYFNFLLTLLSIFIFYQIFTYYNFSLQKIYSAISIFLLLGSSVYQMTVFGNDALSWVLAWSVFLFIIKGIKINWVTLIILLSIFHYTKSSVLVFYPILIFATYKEFKNEKFNSILLTKYILIIILPIVIAFPWYLRNYHIYGSFFSVSTITGETWYFVKSIQESLTKILHMPYLFLFRMHFDPPKALLSWFNVIPNIWFLAAGILAIFRIFRILKEKVSIQLLNLLLFSVVGAYLYYAIPTGYTEGRFLYPALPAILYFMTELLFSKKVLEKVGENIQQVIILLVFLPSFIIGFFF